MHTYLIAIIQGNRFERHSYLLSMHVWWSQMLWLRRNVRVVSHGRRCAKWSCWIRKMMMRMLRKSSSCLLLFTHESRPWVTRILISKHVHVFYLFIFWETTTSAHHIKSISSDRSLEPRGADCHHAYNNKSYRQSIFHLIDYYLRRNTVIVQGL